MTSKREVVGETNYTLGWSGVPSVPSPREAPRCFSFFHKWETDWERIRYWFEHEARPSTFPHGLFERCTKCGKQRTV